MKVCAHRLMCDSEDLKGFLTEADHAFEERKRTSQHLIDLDNADESETYSVMAYNAVTSVLSKASEKIGNLVWTGQGAGA